MVESNNSIIQEDLTIIANSFDTLCKFKNSNIFITGATGLVGSQLVRAFACCNRVHDLNMKIFLFVRNEGKAKKIYGELLNRSDIEIVVGDVLDSPLTYITEDIKIDYLIHAASITSSKIMIERPVDVIDISVMGTRNMLEVAKLKKAKGFVYISSMEMYGQFFEENNYVNENQLGYLDLQNIRNNYPESKRLCENMCIGFMSQYGLPIYIARLSQTFGAGILPGENRVFAQFAYSAIEGKDIVLHTKGLSEGNYCYTRDMVKGIITILLNGKAGEVYNVVNENTHTSISNMAQLVAKEIAKDKIKVIYDIPKENVFGYASDTKLKLSSKKLESIGWKADVNLIEAYERMIKSLLEK